MENKTTDFIEVQDIGSGQSYLVFYSANGEKHETPPMDIWRANKIANAVEEALATWEGWK